MSKLKLKTWKRKKAKVVSINDQLAKVRKYNTPYCIAIDAEWDKRFGWLCTQITTREHGTVVYMRSDLPSEVKTRLVAHAGLRGVTLVWIDDIELWTPVTEYRMRFGITSKDMWALIFFSPKDVEYSVSWDRFDEAISEGKIRQKGHLAGVVPMGDYKLRIKDLKGWAAGDSLANFSNGLGVGDTNKGLVSKDEKKRMHDVLVNRPEDFLDYATSDSTVLFDVMDRFVEFTRRLQDECHAIPEVKRWVINNIPFTMGSLVAGSFKKWLYTLHNEGVFKFCILKQGMLDVNHKDYNVNVDAYNRIVDKIRSVAELERMLNVPDEDMSRFYNAKYVQNALSACSVKQFAGQSEGDSIIYNAVVQGGRCNNEIPQSQLVHKGADIDIQGCYAKALNDLTYPIGLPTTWSSAHNQNTMAFGSTLGEWLDKYKNRLVPLLWTAVVSGTLTFEQDLVFSKKVEPRNIRKATATDGDEDSDIASQTLLPRSEIVNGIITSDILEVILKAGTSREIGEFRRLKIVTAVAYLADDMASGFDEWTHVVVADRGSRRIVDNGEIVDDRTRCWVGVPLRSYVGELFERRKYYKGLAKKTSDPETLALASGMDKTLKLSINTLYGAKASRYFDTGNTVVGNNITARARVGVWMLAKSLGLRQCITDGGIYKPSEVNVYNPNRKPSLDILSRMWEWKDSNRGRKIVPLQGEDWEKPIGEWCNTSWHEGKKEWGNLATLDKLAGEHNRKFWEPYGLTLPFDLEHKTLFYRAAYISKADYMFKMREEDSAADYKSKIRGKKKDATKPHPHYEVLTNIIEDRDDFPETLYYTKKGIVTVSQYKQARKSKGFKHLDGLRPGDEYEQAGMTARYNNTHFPIKTMSEFERRVSRRRKDHGKDVLLFERYAPSIAEVYKNMEADRLVSTSK